MSSIMQMAGSIASGIQNVYGYRRQQQVYKAQAAQAQRESLAEVGAMAMRGRRLEAAAIAQAGAADMAESPSALDVMVENALAVGRDISAARYRGAMAEWGLTEGEKAAGWAKHMTALTGFGEAAGHAAAGWDKYGGKLWNNAPEATKEMWFSNAQAEAKDDWSGAFGSGGGESAYGGQNAASGIV